MGAEGEVFAETFQEGFEVCCHVDTAKGHKYICGTTCKEKFLMLHVHLDNASLTEHMLTLLAAYPELPK